MDLQRWACTNSPRYILSKIFSASFLAHRANYRARDAPIVCLQIFSLTIKKQKQIFCTYIVNTLL